MNQEDKLKQEILSDAKAKAEKIIARAQNEADAMVEQARQDAAKKREARLAEANVEADKKCRAIGVEIELEINRRWLLKQESCIDDLLKKALAAADKADGFDRQASLASLTKEALRTIGDCDCTVSFNPADAATVTMEWISSLAREIYPNSSHVYELKADAKVDGGIELETEDGARQVDNSYGTRLQRMKDDLRIMAVK